MIERYFRPRVFIVTGVAAVLQRVLVIHESTMHVLMTIDAIAANIPETPPIFFLVTGKAGSSHVGTVQLKVTQIMLFYGIIGELKSLNRVTIFTIGGRLGSCEIAFVVVGVAIAAPVMG